MSVLRRKVWALALLDLFTCRTLDGSGGVAFICTAGTPDLATLYNAETDAALSNPVSLTRGAVRFATLETVETVDLHILTPTGQFVSFYGMNAQEFNELKVDTQRRDNLAVIPFSVSHSGYAAATEFDSGFDFPLNSMLLAQPAIQVTTVDATETLDVGIKSSETSGDADGILAAVSVATAAFVKGTVLNGSNTMGALFEVQDSANAGDIALEGYILSGSHGRSLSWTLSAGSDTAKGYILVPYRLISPGSALMA